MLALCNNTPTLQAVESDYYSYPPSRMLSSWISFLPRYMEESSILQRIAFGVFCAFVYRLLVCYFLGRCSWKDHPLIALRFPKASSSEEEATNLWSHCCPKRRARWFKCARRCQQRKQRKAQQARHHHEEHRSTSHENENQDDRLADSQISLTKNHECPIYQFFKLHLPPPLPIRCKQSASNCRKKAPDSVVTQPFSSDENYESSRKPSACCSPCCPSTCCEEPDENAREATCADYTLPQESGKEEQSSEEMELPETVSDDQHRESQESQFLHCPVTLTAAVQRVLPQLPPVLVSKQPSRPISTLLDLCRMQHWDSIVQLSASWTKREAKYHDADGLYPLHWACSGGPPVIVIEILLQVYPHAVKKMDAEGSTPLHFACHYSASASVVEVLATAYPKAACQQDRYGRCPLFHAVDKSAGIDVLKALVRADSCTITTSCYLPPSTGSPLTSSATTGEASSGLSNSEGQQLREGSEKMRLLRQRELAAQTPLFIAWANVLLQQQYCRRRGCGNSNCNRAGSKSNVKRGKRWEKAEYLLMAAYDKHCKHNPSPLGSMLEEEKEDELQQLLLAVIAMDMYLPEPTLSFVLEFVAAQKSTSSGVKPLLLAASTRHYSAARSNEVIQLLLNAFPQAVRERDKHGRSPLAMALKAEKTWQAGVSELFRALPLEALSWTDDTTGLVPCLLAATSGTVNTQKTGMEWLWANHGKISKNRHGRKRNEEISVASTSAPADQTGTTLPTGTLTPLTYQRKYDPFNFLTSKHHEWMLRRIVPRTNGEASHTEELDPELDILNTIFHLIQADPSVLQKT